MEILMTGASGFVGARLAARLARRHGVVATYRFEPPSGAAGGIRWVRVDLSDPGFVRALPRRVEAVVHLAQSREFRKFPAGARDMFAVNVAATQALLEHALAAGRTRFILASTGGVYGFGPRPFRETDPADFGESFYIRSKHAAEVLAQAYAGHLDVVTLRFFFVYGPGQEDRLIPNLFEKVEQGEPVRISGRGGIRLNPIYVDDAAAAVEAALGGAHLGAINVAGTEVISVRALADRVGRLVGRPPVFQRDPALPPGDLVGSIVRLRRALGVAPRVRLQEGLARVHRSLRGVG